MFLSDDAAAPRQWMIPSGTIIKANGFLILWADNDTEQEGLHTNFKLSSAGESLFIVASDSQGNQLLDSISFGSLSEDESIGRIDETGTIAPIGPTPGAANF